MPVAIDAKTTSTWGNSGTSPKTVSHTPVGTPTLAVVCVHRFRDPSGDSPGVTYGGASMTKIEADNGGYPCTGIYYKENPASGTQNVVLSWNNSQNGGYLQIITFTGTPTSSALGTQQTAIGTGTSSSLSVSGYSGGLILDALSFYDNPGTITTGADQSVQLTGNSGVLYFRESTELGAGTNTMSWSWVHSKYYAHVLIPIKAVPVLYPFCYLV
jgi:hypothetical protein